MENVEAFSIEYDIADRKSVYDYVTCTEYTRPPTGWDYSLFRSSFSGLDCLDEDDENGHFRVKLMDRAITDHKRLEKRVKQQVDEDKAAKKLRESDDHRDKYSWLENFDDRKTNQLPRRTFPIFQHGDVIKGSVVLSLSKSMKASKLVVGFQGRSFVSVRCSNGKTVYDVTGEELFVKEKITLWEKSGDSSAGQDEFSLLSLNGQPGRVSHSNVLPPGRHTFPFEFVVPMEVPQSAPPVVISRYNKGYLLYRIKAVIDQDHLGGQGNIITHRGLGIKKDVDIALDPELMEPIETEETLEPRLSRSGQITAKATLKRAGWVLGEPIPIQIEIQNDTNRDIQSVSSYIRVFGKARVKDSKLSVSNSIDIKAEKAKEEGVPARQSRIINGVLSWTCSHRSVDWHLLPVGNMDDSKQLDIKYEVRVDIKRTGIHRDMHLNIPITTGSHNSKKQID